ncbi:Spy Predicted O-linked N-acetylglucosamine transferase, SPINDLY family [Methylophilaceae bacterium]
MQENEIILALKQIQEVLLHNPKDLEAQIKCANICVELKRFEEAAGYFRRIVRMHKHNMPARDALCFVLQEMGNTAHAKAQFVQAEACFEEALIYQPNNADFWYNMGNAQRELGKLTAALNSFKQSIRFNPNDADAQNNCGNVQRELGLLNHAIASYEKALQIKPDLHHALAHLVHQKQHICDWDNIDLQIKQLRDWVKTEPSAQISTFAFLSMQGATSFEQKQCASNWASSFYNKLIKQHTGFDFTHLKTQQTKLKIGYLSADFRLHPLAYLITELIENSDKTLFETVAYSYGKDDKTSERKRLEKAFDCFNDIKHLTDMEAAQKIHQDGVAILVDLTGFTQNSRTGIVALKPAPISINWLGFAGTMGEVNRKPLFDYVISDKIISLNQADDMSEELLYLPCYQPNNSQRPVGNPTTKNEHNLPENSFVFCCFNQSFKITPVVFAIWMRILYQTPNSVFWLLDCNTWARDNLRNAAEKAGIDNKRLIFAPRLAIAEHLERQIHADLFLDTSPYNAHTSASDALWMGLPLLTRMGDTFASRVAGSLLKHINLPELIAQNWQEYEDKALFFAKNPTALNDLKQKLTTQITHSSLFKPDQFARNLEQRYQQIWQTYQAKID